MRKGWKKASLGDCIQSITSGVSVNSEDRPAASNEIGILKTSCVYGGSFDSSQNKLVLEKERSRAKCPIKKDTIIVSRMNTAELVGASGLVTQNLPNLFLPDRLWCVTPTKNVEPQWLAAVIGSPSCRTMLTNMATGTSGSMKNISQDGFCNIPVLLPPLAEQRKIAAILRTWDDAIEKSQKLVDAHRKRLSSLTLALVFGRLRLSRRCSSDRTKYKLISGPNDWKLFHIGDVAFERSELNVGGAAHTVLSCSKHDGFVKSLDFFKKQVFSKDLASYKIICRGDFGFPSNHVEEGSIGLQNIADKAVVSPIYIVFTPNTKHVHPDFLFRLLKTKTYAHIFRTATSSSVDRRGNLRWTEFSKIPLFLPGIKEQTEINAFLNEQQKLIEGLEQYRQTLVTQKRGLMQKLLTGEWRVNVSGDAEAA